MLYRKGSGMEAKLCYIGHTLMENRNGLLVDARLTKVSGRAERLAALDMIEPRADRPEAITLGGDKGFDSADFVMELREINVTPHIARNTTRRSAIDGRTDSLSGYAASQRIRKRIEEGFRWMKTIAGLRKTKYLRPRKSPMGLHPRSFSLQSDPVAEVDGGSVNRSAIGRIIAAIGRKHRTEIQPAPDMPATSSTAC